MLHRQKRKTYQVSALAPTALFLISLLSLSGRLPTVLNTETPTFTPTVPSSVPDVQGTLNAQATQILGQVTLQAAIDQTSTAIALGTTRPSVSLTPTRTRTPPPPLAQQVGFSDPELSKLEAEQTNLLHESIAFSAYQHRYRLLFLWSTRFDFFPPGGAVILYQTDLAQPRYLWKHDDVPGTPMSINMPPPGDWNGDGRIYFAYNGDTGGNGWGIHSWYSVYELRSDGTVISVLKHAIAPDYLVLKIERKTGYMELTASRLDMTGYRWLNRYYKLEGGQVINAWADHLTEYLDRVSGAIYHATTAKVLTDYDAQDFAGSLFVILDIYEAIEEREAGWLLVQDLVSEAKRTNRLADGTYIDKTFMPTMSRLYEENWAFVPPPVDFSQPEVGTYDRDD